MGSSTPSTNTVTSSQQIPEFEQQASEQNQELAQSIGSQPFPTYQGALIQPMDALQTQGQQQAVDAATAYQPGLNQATGTTQGALNSSGLNAYSGAATGEIGNALQTNAATPGAIQSYMNPYESAALAPQIQDLQLQQGQQQQQINTQATQDAAFGDARQGSAQALQNLYGNQALNQLVGTGYNNAYTAAQSALQSQQGAELSGASQLGNLASLQGTEQNTQLAGGAQLANIAGQDQSLGLAGANATYAAGQQNQTQGQTELNAAYQQYLNQVNWPTQMLNVQESALSNSPYNIATAVTLPSANSTAQGFGAISGLAGLLGSAGSSSAGGGAGNVFGAS